MHFTKTLVTSLLAFTARVSARRTSRVAADKIPGGTDLTLCEDYDENIDLTKVTFFEYERKGYLNITGTSKYTIDGEAGFAFLATLGTYSKFVEGELCTEGGLNCPIKKDEKFHATYKVPNLGSFPPQLFTIDVRFWDNDNEPLLCLNGKFALKKSSTEEKMTVQDDEHMEM